MRGEIWSMYADEFLEKMLKDKYTLELYHKLVKRAKEWKNDNS